MNKQRKTLREIEREITRLEDELWSLGKTVLQKALRYGELLTEARALLKHGQWMPWLKKHVRLSQSTVWHMMKLHESRQDPELVKLLKSNNLAQVTEAYYVLGLPWGDKFKPDDAAGSKRIVDRLTKWEAMTLDLLKLNVEEAIGNFIEIISKPDATPEQQLMWEILVRQVKQALKGSKKKGAKS